MFVYSELPDPEKEKFMEFMINNTVEFIQDTEGHYLATIKIINQNRMSRALTPSRSSAAVAASRSRQARQHSKGTRKER